MLWMEEKWPRVADECSQACSTILQKLKWHKITQSELLASHRYMEDLQQDVREMMEHLQGALQSTETRQDLCSSRRLQRQHCQLEDKSQALANKIAALISQTHNAFTSWTILEESQNCHQRFKSLQNKLATRHQQLQASVELYEFNFLSNLELTWVAEHMPSAGPICPAQCWRDAQSLQQKHKIAPSASCHAPNIAFPDL